MLTPKEYEMLKSCFLFSEIIKTEEGKDKYNSFLASKYCKILEFLKGETVFGEEKDNRLGILLKGRAVAACSSGEKSSLKIFSSGEIFGAASIFCTKDKSSFAKVKASTACRVLFITKEGIENLIKESPETALKYISFLSDRALFLNHRISTFTSNQATTRLCKYILNNEKQNEIKNVNFASLARTLDISRASLYRARKELETINAVRFDSKSITIIDKKALQKEK